MIIKTLPFILIAILFSSCTQNLFEYQPDIPNGGHIIALSKDQANDNKIIAASATGGLFISSDAGNDWSHVSTLSVFEMNDVKICPSNSNIVLATCSRDLRVNNGGGIWRSTDGGATWSKPPTSVYSRFGTPVPGHGFGICFEPAPSSRVYVGTENGIAVSNDYGATWTYDPIFTFFTVQTAAVLAKPGGTALAATSFGIYKTTNGGVNWTLITSSIISTHSTRALCYSPLNFNNVFVTDDGYNIFYSGDFGGSWKAINSPGGKNREPFVRCTTENAVIFGAQAKVTYLYFGGGVDCFYKILPNAEVNNSNIFFGNDWVKMDVDHTDPSDIVFNSNGNPILLSGDGGVQNTTTNGNSWHYTGGGHHGLNALQVNEATAQENYVQGKRDFIYFGTQDNYLWASPDGGHSWTSTGNEGHSIQTRRRSVQDLGNLMVFTLDDSVSQRSCKQLYDSVSDWPEVPVRAGDPVLVFEGDLLDPAPRNRFIQTSFVKGFIARTRISFDHYNFNNTLNGGAKWNTIGSMSYAPTAQYPKISNSGEPVVYQPVSTSATTKNGFPKVGLMKLINTNRVTEGTVIDAGGNGFGSLGTYPTEFKWYNPFAVNPTDPDGVVIADIEDSTVKFTMDGGQNWYPNYRLTDLITNNGQINFYQTIGCCPRILVSCISYNPDNPDQIAIGTTVNGIFFTWDKGSVWYKLDNTDQITNVSSITFYFDGTILVSAYGRGLWKFKPQKSSTFTTFLFPGQKYIGPQLVDLGKKTIHPMGSPGKAGIGANGLQIVASADTGLTISRVIQQQSTILNIKVLGKDTLHRERIPLELKLPDPKTLSSFYHLLSKDPIATLPVRAVLYDNNNQVTAFVVSELPYRIYAPDELVVKENTNPYVHVLDDSLNAVMSLKQEESYYLKGDHFTPSTKDTSSLVQIFLGGQLKAKVPVDSNGIFLTPIDVDAHYGAGVQIKVIQKAHDHPVQITYFVAVERPYDEDKKNMKRTSK